MRVSRWRRVVSTRDGITLTIFGWKEGAQAERHSQDSRLVFKLQASRFARSFVYIVMN
jgi:hypothetical protein